jgi:hypothetical protein
MEKFSVRDEIIEVVNKLFIYTDSLQWDKLEKEVFTEKVFFDMSSLGGDKEEKSAVAICALWAKGFEGIDSVNHLAGNYLVTIDNISAVVFAYATATHYKASAVNGKTREFTGTYDIRLARVPGGWRINHFKYDLKYMTGNAELV